MRRFSLIDVTAILFLMAFLFLGLGCSNDSSTSPVDVTDDVIIDDNPMTDNGTFALAEPGSYIETFDDSSNVGNWSFYTSHYPIYETTGGNLDWYLHDDNVVSFAPHAGTAIGVESVFSGDYKARNVTSIGIDLRSIDYLYDISTRYLAVQIMSDNGTPDDVTDDWGAYCVGPDHVPSKYVAWLTCSAPGWVSYDFAIDAQSRKIPAGWNYYAPTADGSKKTTGSWSTLMQNVSYIQFSFGDPTQIYFLNEFDLGMDNPRISWE